MAHRQDEKQRRREERLARERAEEAAAARKKRVQLAFGGVLALALVAGIVVLATVGLGGGSNSSAKGQPTDPSSVNASVHLPTQQTSDINAAAKAAGCTLQNPPIEGRQHEVKDFKPSDYKTNPPTSGNHYPQWYDDGIYKPGDVPNLGMLVHTLEHGRIDVQYRPGTPKSTIDGLEALLVEQNNGYHMLLYQNTTGMKYAVAAAAWGHLLGCPAMNPKVYDALRTFRERYIDKGPEQVP